MFTPFLSDPLALCPNSRPGLWAYQSAEASRDRARSSWAGYPNLCASLAWQLRAPDASNRTRTPDYSRVIENFA
eukprot:292884-Pleurochrysis_carterae.AAC.1